MHLIGPDYIVIGCSMTKPDVDMTFRDLDKKHRREGRYGCGFHIVILRDGTVAHGRPMTQPGNHTRGSNRNSIGVCLIGGLDEDGQPAEFSYSHQQMEALVNVIFEMKIRHPKAQVVGSCDLNKRTKAPCFNVADLLINHPRLNNL